MVIYAGTANLHKLVSVLDPGKVAPPKSLNIITGTGISYTRPDGINVISIASLGFNRYALNLTFNAIIYRTGIIFAKK